MPRSIALAKLHPLTRRRPITSLLNLPLHVLKDPTQIRTRFPIPTTILREELLSNFHIQTPSHMLRTIHCYAIFVAVIRSWLLSRSSTNLPRHLLRSLSLQSLQCLVSLVFHDSPLLEVCDLKISIVSPYPDSNSSLFYCQLLAVLSTIPPNQ